MIARMALGMVMLVENANVMIVAMTGMIVLVIFIIVSVQHSRYLCMRCRMRCLDH
ncbi:hypothetical protein [Hyphomonas polymorpha]|uniref:hypothetical protein n=1 Tax=Hyphomonas polymorpha TaxID=74319 RepID=UPI0012FACB22|nr:hypothetical protein [Hyphomonas polymorpha]